MTTNMRERVNKAHQKRHNYELEDFEEHHKNTKNEVCNQKTLPILKLCVICADTFKSLLKRHQLSTTLKDLWSILENIVFKSSQISCVVEKKNTKNNALENGFVKLRYYHIVSTMPSNKEEDEIRRVKARVPKLIPY